MNFKLQMNINYVRTGNKLQMKIQLSRNKYRSRLLDSNSFIMSTWFFFQFHLFELDLGSPLLFHWKNSIRWDNNDTCSVWRPNTTLTCFPTIRSKYLPVILQCTIHIRKNSLTPLLLGCQSHCFSLLRSLNFLLLSLPSFLFSLHLLLLFNLFHSPLSLAHHLEKFILISLCQKKWKREQQAIK